MTMVHYDLSHPYLVFLCRVGGFGTATHGWPASGCRHDDAQKYGSNSWGTLCSADTIAVRLLAIVY